MLLVVQYYWADVISRISLMPFFSLLFSVSVRLVLRFWNIRIILQIILVLNWNIYIKITQGSISTSSKGGHGKNQSRHFINRGKRGKRGRTVPMLPFVSVFTCSQYHFCKLVRLNERSAWNGQCTAEPQLCRKNCAHAPLIPLFRAFRGVRHRNFDFTFHNQDNLYSSNKSVRYLFQKWFQLPPSNNRINNI